MSGFSCSAARAETPARLAGELSTLQQERFDLHQRACANCSAFLDLLARALASARADPPELSVVERDFEYAALMERLNEGPSILELAPIAGNSRVKTRWTLALAAAVVAVALGPTPTADVGSIAALAKTSSEGARPPIDFASPSPSSSSLRPPFSLRKTPKGPSYADAERALEQRGPADAAGVLERLLTWRPRGVEADTARLELGRLYAGPLGRPEAAERHLRAFLRRNPTGAGVTAATISLCHVDPRDSLCISEGPARD